MSVRSIKVGITSESLFVVSLTVRERCDSRRTWGSRRLSINRDRSTEESLGEEMSMAGELQMNVTHTFTAVDPEPLIIG